MAGPEIMAETPPGATEATSPTTLSATPPKELPIYRAANFDPNRKDYQARIMDTHVSWFDPITGAEVARMPKMEGGAGAPLSPEALLEKTKETESDPQHWMNILKELHNLPVAERAEGKNEIAYDQACKRLAEFAHDKKLFDNSPKVTILEKQLTDFEKQEIKAGNRPEVEQQKLQDLLDDLTKQENELIRVDNTLGLKEKAPSFFTKAQWQEHRDKVKQLWTDPDEGINKLKAEISSRTSAGFLSKRDSLKNNIAEATRIVKDQAEEQKQTQLNELLGEPRKWEIGKENELLLNEDKATAHTRQLLPTFSQELERLNQQGDLEGVSRRFHEARGLGVFSDLEERLDGKYQEWANALIPRREVSPFDRYGERSGRITRKTFSEIQDEIIEYFNGLLDPSKPQYVEQDARWNFLQRRGLARGLIPQKRQELQGIRAELVRRAQIQIEDSLANFDTELRGQVDLTHIYRISGEWNVHRLERHIRAERERHEVQERSRPLFIQETYYRIVLTGKNRKEIEQGADQAAESIIQSATTFSLDVVRQRMEQLMTGIKEAQTTLQANETDGRISETDARELVKEIQHKYTNKLDFFILDWLSGNLLMDQFASYYSDRMRMAGDEKIKLIPAGHDGLDGLAIHWLTSPEFRLYHRPQGFKGQLYDDDETHKRMRDWMKEQIVERLMEYELKGEKDQEKAKNRQKLTYGPTIHEYLQRFDHTGIIPPGIFPEDIIPADAEGKKDPTKYFKNLTWGKRDQLFRRLTPDQRKQLFSLFDQLTPDEKVDIRRFQYEQILEQVQAGEKQSRITFEDLARVRAARQILAQAQQNLQETRASAESAFDTADKVLNIFGEAAFLNSPSIVMENGPEIKTVNDEIIKRGDYISINDAVLFYKYAILNAAVISPDGKKYKCGMNDQLALIRYRARVWMGKCQKAGWDRSKTDGTFITTLPNGQQISVRLKKGFEETGLTEAEWQAFEDAAKQLREKGYQAEIGSKKFEDIIKMDELQPVMNNFLADYKSSMSGINDPNVLERVARGRFISIDNVRKRLGFSRRLGLEGTTQQEIDEYSQRIEDSRSLHAELERLAYFEATHDLTKPPIMEERGRPIYAFSANRVDYGYQRSWGVKRLHHLKAFWYSNLRRTIPRGVDLVHALPLSLTSLSREMSFDNFLQMCWEVKKMESIDNPSLVMMGERHKALVYLRGRGEGGISESQVGWSKGWGFFEKPLVDSNGLRKLFHTYTGLHPKEIIQAIEKGTFEGLSDEKKEEIVNYFQETTLSRFAPILMATEKSLGEDRQALSAGSSFEENAKFALRFLEWLLSEKSESVEHRDREEGGLKAYEEVADILKLITIPNSYEPGFSIWDEVWRKITPSHNIRLPNRGIQPTYVALTA